MKKYLVLWVLVIESLVVAAQSHEDRVNALISRGNHAYELSQRSVIKQCADSAALILNTVKFDDNTRKDFTVSMLKLYGNYHYESDALDSAEYYYNQAKLIIDQNPEVSFKGGSDVLMLRELAQLYYRRTEYQRAAELMAEVDEAIEGWKQPYEPGDDNWLITKMTYAMCLARVGEFENALDIATQELKNAIDKRSLEYSKALRMYGKIKLLADADKVGALSAYKTYFAHQKSYALENFAHMNAQKREEYWHTLQPFIADCYLMEEADPGFLYDVTLFSKGLLLQISSVSGEGNASATALKSLDYKWTDIQKNLKRNEAAIEFIQYGDRMAAIVLKSVGIPKFIPLISPQEILSLFEKSLQSTARSDKDELYSNEQLQSLVWTPLLLKELKDISKVYFAPDGYMHRLAIEYMPQVKMIDLCRLTSTRRLMDRKREEMDLKSALLMGGINYDLDKSPRENVDNDVIAYNNYKGRIFPLLSESSNEAIDIYKFRNSPSDTLIKGSKASETVFLELAPLYSSILVSTHGDFCAKTPVNTDLTPVVSSDFMSQNVIAFSGVNSYLRDKGFDPARSCDGLLSAKELASMDLSKCKLFIISACQSGLGEITSDGVFGLQRGLKNAGVQVMLLSLWNVNSDAAAMLMREFYKHLNSGESIRKAFASARQYLLDSREELLSETTVFNPAIRANKRVILKTEAYNTPQFTDAFILIDALD